MRAEQRKWVTFYRLLAELGDCEPARQARRIVFGASDKDQVVPPLCDQTEKISREMLKISRRACLAAFRLSHSGVTDRAVYRAACVHQSDFYRFMRGEIKESSAMAERIKSTLGRF